MPSKIKQIVLYKEVADIISQQIYAERFMPGDWIDEKLLCEELGISRTPLREALKVLAADGLIELIPRRGSFVRGISKDELTEIFPIMAVLEGLCATEAVHNASDRDIKRLDDIHTRLKGYAEKNLADEYYEENLVFHEYIQRLANNSWLEKITGDLRKVIRLSRRQQMNTHGRIKQSVEEHEAIMQAFRDRSPERADQAMATHLRSQQVTFEKSLTKEATLDQDRIQVNR